MPNLGAIITELIRYSLTVRLESTAPANALAKGMPPSTATSQNTNLISQVLRNLKHKSWIANDVH